MIIVAYYTKNTPYEQEIQNLVASIDRLGLNYYVHGYESRGHWLANIAIKPEFILDMLNRFPNQDLLYIDADAVIYQYPSFYDSLDSFVDVSVHYLRGKELLSGTIFLRNNERVHRLVHRWLHIQTKHPGSWDQVTLDQAIKEDKNLRVEVSPPQYTQIFDIMKDSGDPVIEHQQASRRFKRKVGSKENVPTIIENQRLRFHSDGSFTLVRRNHDAMKFLDEHFIRVKGEQRWFPQTDTNLPLETIEPIFRHTSCYIIGKGPSLDNVTHRIFTDPHAPIICINESIHKIESLDLQNPLYVMQQDETLRNRCLPQYGTLLVSVQAAKHYSLFPRKIIYNPAELGGAHSMSLTVVCAIKLAQKFDTTEIRLVAFDASVNKKLDYARCVDSNVKEGGDPERFLNHRQRILSVSNVPIKWITPRHGNRADLPG